MPKMKTHRGAAKRFKVSATGKIIRRKGYKSHILEKKSAKRRRNLGQAAVVSSGDEKRVKKLLPYA
ncbi:MAG: 50S ribosomal protein L35 [Firmicutes bacterium]|nr:50S ribosomal protein L35 [Bacillota bacterium]MCL5038787.1 50S ribosomal protein L35 [Bacillota bacterium]